MASDKSGNSSWWSSSWNSLVQTAKEKVLKLENFLLFFLNFHFLKVNECI